MSHKETGPYYKIVSDNTPLVNYRHELTKKDKFTYNNTGQIYRSALETAHSRSAID